MSGLVGQTLLSRYRVDGYLASGGMGAVFKVWDIQRGVPLAMKVLHADLADDPSAYKRFEREGRALQKLSHPNIVPFYGLYRSVDMTFLLEEYIDGPTLKQFLRGRPDQRLSVSEALIYLKALSLALGYAHQHGVVHCDVKPGNVMIGRGGRIYLADFGIARHAESTTTTLGFAGTAAYMAPEQCRAAPVSAATDVYALGVIAFEMFAGRRPFLGDEKQTAQAGTGAERMRYAQQYLDPPDPRSFNADLPEALAGAVMQALNKQPEGRFRSVNAFFQALCRGAGIPPESIPDRIVLTDAPPQPAEPHVQQVLKPTHELRERKRVPRWAFAAGGAAVVVLALALALSGGAASSSGSEYTQLGSSAGSSNSSAVPQSTSTSRAAADTNRSATPTPQPRSPYRPIVNCPISRLQIGDWTRVSLDPLVCNRLRTATGADSTVMTCVDPGVTMRVIDGPICMDGWLWWRVAVTSGPSGWMAEGDGYSYWVDAGTRVEP
ncbi:MAG: serine/threonine protein kinase [Anaerolineales bacterium]|nr:serine/threonine protein kinase [Anaerolineales bacterium]